MNNLIRLVDKNRQQRSSLKHTFSKDKTGGSKRDIQYIAILKHLIASQKYEDDIINNTLFLNENKYGFIL